jgi:cell division protein DivIC
LTLVIFGVYILFLDDVDIFSILKQQLKLSKIERELVDMQEKLDTTKETLSQLNDLESIEKFAREQKMFKKHDEDIFIIVEE